MKLLIRIFLLMVLTFIFWINLRLYHHDRFSTIDGVRVNQNLLTELRSLRSSLESGAAVDMQQLFPEGYVFMNSLYGLSWCELAAVVPHSSDLYNEAHREIQRSYKTINSEIAKSIFNEHLPIPYGAYYIGWNSYFLGKKLSIENAAEQNPDEVNSFKERCELISKVIAGNESPYPASYSDGAWPADVVMCVATLSIHDRLFEPKYKDVINAWLKKVKSNLDENGLIPHSVNVKTGSPLESARGSSQSLILVLLRDIDKDFSMQQFIIYKDLFLDYRFGLPGIREYPKGAVGSVDVDSGPIILQMGGAATIVGIQTMYLYDEKQTSLELRNGIESLGVPITLFGTKKYLFGILPMADAFIIWSHSKSNLKEEAQNNDSGWRIKFHAYSLIPVSLIALLLLYNFGLWFNTKSTS